MSDVSTCKFVADASLNNDSFIHCMIYWLLEISTTGQICSFLWTRKNKKAFTLLQGGFAPPDPHLGLCPLDPRWWLRPVMLFSSSHVIVTLTNTAHVTVISYYSKIPISIRHSTVELFIAVHFLHGKSQNNKYNNVGEWRAWAMSNCHQSRWEVHEWHIGLASAIVNKLSRIWKSSNISNRVKVRLYETFVLSVLG